MKDIYLDHAATTPVDRRVVTVMLPFFTKKYGNPSALHQIGRQAKQSLGLAREKVAKIFNCAAQEIIFTGSGTESDNLAVLGAASSYQERCGKLGHIVTSAFEHHAVLYPCQYLEKNGWQITYLKPNRAGIISPAKVQQAIQKNTALVSIIYANNEVGTIQPIVEIARVVKNKGALFHTDACQAAGALTLDVKKLGVDLMTINGSKIYGPKGVGVLYLGRDVLLNPIQFGGGQERELRPGTENIPLIVGLAKALEIAQKKSKQENARLTKLRDRLIRGILAKVPNSKLNGDSKKRLPNNVNISILGVEGEAMLLYLDEKGISASTGSACASYDLEPSHVLISMGLPRQEAHGSIRFTLGRSTTRADIDYVLKVLPKVVKKLLEISPVNQKSYRSSFGSLNK